MANKIDNELYGVGDLVALKQDPDMMGIITEITPYGSNIQWDVNAPKQWESEDIILIKKYDSKLDAKKPGHITLREGDKVIHYTGNTGTVQRRFISTNNTILVKFSNGEIIPCKLSDLKKELDLRPGEIQFVPDQHPGFFKRIFGFCYPKSIFHEQQIN